MDNNEKSQITPATETTVSPPVNPPVYIPRPYVPRSATVEYKAFRERATSSKGMLITILSIVLGIAFIETLFLGSAGISVPIFAAAFYSTLFYFFRENGKPLNKTAVYLTIPTLFLSISFFIHYNPSTQFISWLTLIVLISIQLILLSGIKATGLFSLDMAAKVIKNLIGRPFMNLGMPFYSFGILKNNKSQASKNLIYVLIGLLVSAPVAAILMALFMSADPVFAHSVEKIINFIGLDFEKVFADMILGLISGLFLASALLGLKFENIEQKPSSRQGCSINSIIIGTALCLINIFILAFVGFQFVYLFGGSVNIEISNMTYAEYARRGFFELSTASGIIFAIALFALFMTKKVNGKLPSLVQLSIAALCVCNGVLLVSAVKRMLLYVDVYGLSVKRVLTLWFMAIIGLCLLWIIMKSFIPRMDVMKWIGLTAIVGVCILSMANTERFIARFNVNSYLSNPVETAIDINYLGALSYTAVPEIARLREAPEENISDEDINYILQKQKVRLQYRHQVYGFTLDRIEAERILNKIPNE